MTVQDSSICIGYLSTYQLLGWNFPEVDSETLLCDLEPKEQTAVVTMRVHDCLNITSISNAKHFKAILRERMLSISINIYDSSKCNLFYECYHGMEKFIQRIVVICYYFTMYLDRDQSVKSPSKSNCKSISQGFVFR